MKIHLAFSEVKHKDDIAPVIHAGDMGEAEEYS